MIHSADHKEKLYVIKIGGNVIDDPVQLDSFLRDFSTIKHKKILIHGGGKIATTIGEKLGITSRYTGGRRITDDDTIGLVTMVYGGLINKRVVALLQSFQCNALGITGADGDLLPAVKRPVTTIDFGWAGDILTDAVNIKSWKFLIEAGFVPVVASLTHDRKGHMLNTNADTVASVIATKLSSVFEVSLVFCFEREGVLENIQDSDSLIVNLNPQKYQELKDNNRLFEGILPKIDNAFEAVRNGVKEVLIGNSLHLSSLLLGKGGTKISMK